MKKIISINKAFKYPYKVKQGTYEEYLPNDDFNGLEELKKILKNSIKYTQSQELKLGLDIILILISHENKDIRASVLGKLFLFVDDEIIQYLIIKELKSMSTGTNKYNNSSAQYSLDVIATEIHKLDLIEVISNLLIRLEKTKINVKNSKVIASLVYLIDKLISIISKNKTKNDANYRYGLLYTFYTIFNRTMNMFMYLEENEDLDNKITKNRVTHYSNPINLEFNKKDSLQRLANFYAQTFMEKGHLRRLIALLDDDDGDIQQIGVNALIDVAEVILNRSNEEPINLPEKSYSKEYSPTTE